MAGDRPTRAVNVTASGNVDLSTIVKLLADNPRLHPDPTSLAPSSGRVVEESDTGNVFIADGSQWLKVSDSIGFNTSALSVGSSPFRMETGSYTGDGTDTGREIDIGFQPDFFTIMRADTGAAAKYSGFSSGVDASHRSVGGTLTNDISSSTQVYATANGITVGDGGTHGNNDGTTYLWMAWSRQ